MPISPLECFLACAGAGLFWMVALGGCAAPASHTGKAAAGSETGRAEAAGPAAMPGARLHKCGIVLQRGAEDAWDGAMVESPSVWYDPHHRRYGMMYVGYGYRPDRVGGRGYDVVSRPQLGLAWSGDLVHWEKDPGNPALGPDTADDAPDRAGMTGPFVWYEAGVYYLFYIGVTEEGYEGGRKTLNLATSTDLKRWVRHEGNPIIAPAGEGWRRDAIWRPYVVEADGTYYLFFNASGVVDGVEEERIGYATSEDLVHWNVDDAHAPVVAGSGTPGQWDAAGRAGDPSLYRVGETWYMAFYSWDRTHAQDGLAWTTAAAFPLGWRMHEQNPVLPVGPPGSFDELHAHKPTVVRASDRHFHFYTAVAGDETREIALATDFAPCP